MIDHTPRPTRLLLGAAPTPMLAGGAEAIADPATTFWFDPIGAASSWSLADGIGSASLVTEPKRPEISALRVEGGRAAEPARLRSPGIAAEDPVEIVRLLETKITFSVRGDRLYAQTADGWNIRATLSAWFWFPLRFGINAQSVAAGINHHDARITTAPSQSGHALDRIELVSAGGWRRIDLVSVATPGFGIHESFMYSAWDDAWAVVPEFDEPTGGGTLKRHHRLGAHDTGGLIELIPDAAHRAYAATSVGWAAEAPSMACLAFHSSSAAVLHVPLLTGLDAQDKPTWVLSLTRASPTHTASPAARVVTPTSAPGEVHMLAYTVPTQTDAWWTVRLDSDPATEALLVRVGEAAPVTVHVERLDETAGIAVGDALAALSGLSAGERIGRVHIEDLVIGSTGRSA